MKRSCSGCTACCFIMPTKEINKPAITRCQHQRTGKGCSIYDRRPMSCRIWSCSWLVDPRTSMMSRPDRSHYVIDPMPDYVTRVEEGKEPQEIAVMVIWQHPNHPDAWKDVELGNYIAMRGEREGMAALIRLDSTRGFIVVPPNMTENGEWFIFPTTNSGAQENSLNDRYAVMEKLGLQNLIPEAIMQSAQGEVFTNFIPEEEQTLPQP